MVARLRGATRVPLVLFTYFNPVHAYGLARFAEHAAASGIDGVLCVDLPPEEAAGEYLDALARSGLDPIFLLAPTSHRARVKAVARAGERLRLLRLAHRGDRRARGAAARARARGRRRCASS